MRNMFSVLAAESASLYDRATFTREGGGIGRRTGFRYQRRKVYGFKSRPSHSYPLEIIEDPKSFTLPITLGGSNTAPNVSRDIEKHNALVKATALASALVSMTGGHVRVLALELQKTLEDIAPNANVVSLDSKRGDK
jgi:hypothetical protein